MNEKDYIISKIKLLTSVFSNIIVEYKFKENSLTHFLKLFPNDLSRKIKFRNFCNDLISEYIKIYKGSICFLSEDDIIFLENPTIFYGTGKLNDIDCSNFIPFNPQNLKKSDNLTSAIKPEKNHIFNKYSVAA